MTDSRELFDKADALLGRYRGENRPEPDFPTLTEVVEAPSAPSAAPAAVPSPEGKGIGDEQLEAMRTGLLAKLQPEIESLLASALEAERQRFEEQLRLAANGLLAKAEADVKARLREILDQAVTESVERLRASL